MRVTILGCGTSTGVPRLPDDWGKCDPGNPKNRRLRASILVEGAGTTILVDTGPDLRQQLLSIRPERLDAVLITHDHADHTHGIDDLRGYYIEQKDEIPLYAPRETLDRLRHRFDYIFASRNGYPPICHGHEIEGPFDVGSISVVPFWQQHGPIWSLGFRFGDIAYSTDLNGLPEESFEILDGVKIWIDDALRERPHRTHAHLDMTLSWIDRVKPERAILTHLSNQMDYDTLVAQLPDGIEPAFDGLCLEL